MLRLSIKLKFAKTEIIITEPDDKRRVNYVGAIDSSTTSFCSYPLL